MKLGKILEAFKFVDKKLINKKFKYKNEIYKCIEATIINDELHFVIKHLFDKEKVESFVFDDGKIPKHIKQLTK